MNFDKQAKSFDIDRRKERAKIIASHILTYIDSDSLSAMEFGCGTGLIGLELINKFSSVTFVDSSQGMINEVNRKIDNIPNAIALHINLLEDKILNQKFDCIFTSMVLHHIKNTSEILTILYDLLNDCGCLIIVDLDKDDGWFHSSETDFDGHNGFDKSAISVLLNDAGFSVSEIKTFYSGSKEINEIPVPYSLFIVKSVKMKIKA